MVPRSFGQDLVTIHRPAAADYRIAVYGYTTAVYTITASTSSVITEVRAWCWPVAFLACVGLLCSVQWAP